MKTNETLKKDKDGYQLLPETFEYKGNTFKFIKNLNNWKIYEKTRKETGRKYYELIKPIKQEAFNFHGTLLSPRWSYPGTNSFGRNGYDCISIERCEQLYKTWVLPRENKNEEPIKDDKISYPEGKFILKDLEKLNKKLTYQQISVKVREDVSLGIVKIVGEKENQRGRASKIYKLK